MSRFRCRVCNKQMNDVPAACPDCGYKPRHIDYSVVVLTCTLFGAALTAILWFRGVYENGIRTTRPEPTASGNVGNNAAIASVAGCFEAKSSDLQPPIELPGPCAPVNGTPLHGGLKGKPFDGNDIESAIGVSNQGR